MSASPLKILPLGLERKPLAMLELAFQHPSRSWCQLSDEDHAEVAILDGDAPGALVMFDQFRQRHPQLPILVLSIREVRLKQAIPVKKPFKIDDLMAALQRARQVVQSGALLADADSSTSVPAVAPAKVTPLPTAVRSVPPKPVLTAEATKPAAPAPVPPTPKPAAPKPVESPTTTPQTSSAAQALESEQVHDLCGTTPDVDLSNSRQLASICYDPGHHLLGLLDRALDDARRHGRGVRVQVGVRPIILFPLQRQCMLPLTDRQLRALCIMPLSGPQNWQLLSSEEERRLLEFPHPQQPLTGLDTLLWKVALWTARGRLPVGTNPNAQVKLRHWPNMTRLELTPHALRVAALWEQKPYSLAESARILAIPQRYVFAFFGACRAIGLVELGATVQSTPHLQTDTPTAQAQPSQSHGNNRGLLQRILNVLRGAA